MVQKLSTQGPQNRVIAAVPLASPGREVGRPSSDTPRLRSELSGAGNKYGQEYARPIAQSVQDPLAKFRPFLDLKEAGGKEAFEGSLAALVKGTPSPVPAPGGRRFGRLRARRCCGAGRPSSGAGAGPPAAGPRRRAGSRHTSCRRSRCAGGCGQSGRRPASGC